MSPRGVGVLRRAVVPGWGRLIVMATDVMNVPPSLGAI